MHCVCRFCLFLVSEIRRRVPETLLSPKLERMRLTIDRLRRRELKPCMLPKCTLPFISATFKFACRETVS